MVSGVSTSAAVARTLGLAGTVKAMLPRKSSISLRI